VNSFGKLFRVSIFGESHGESVGIVVDGCPAGLALTADDLLPDLERRKGGNQEQRPAKKRIIRFSKAEPLMIKLPVSRLRFSLRIIIPAAKIMLSNAAFPVRVMLIG
jgi:hypothetical protein